jgi:type VI secretion system protein ImpK
MNTEPFRLTPVLDQARTLLGEVLQLRQQLEAATESSRYLGRATPGPSVEELRRRLLERVEQQTRPEGAPRGSLEEGRLEEIRYALATFADEMLVMAPWYGRDAWRENLLEDALFHTEEAGDRVFDNVERLLREKDSTRTEVAAVYLMSLALGFEGRYRGLGARTHLQQLQRELFMLIAQRPPEPDMPTRHLIDQAYAHTLTERTERRPPR